MITASSRLGLVQEYRHRNIQGACVDLVPFSMKYAADFVRIRNSERSRYFFNQQYKLTVESQQVWYEKYLHRPDDIFWAVLNKQQRFIGTIRLYDIDPEGQILEQGSFMIDEEVAGTAPYAAEANMLSMDFAFDVLEIGEIINRNRHDNKVMNNLSRKFGFRFVRDTEINGIPYKYYLCNREGYMSVRESIYSLITYWSER